MALHFELSARVNAGGTGDISWSYLVPSAQFPRSPTWALNPVHAKPFFPVPDVHLPTMSLTQLTSLAQLNALLDKPDRKLTVIE